VVEPVIYNRPFGWEFVIDAVEHRLGMWVGRPTYEHAVALVTGFDMAQVDSVHPLLQQRVSMRHGTGPITWATVLRAEALDVDVASAGDLGPLTPDQDGRAIKLLVGELRAVLGIGADSPG
jgi:hypothetical protein